MNPDMYLFWEDSGRSFGALARKFSELNELLWEL